jgi:hypothetical protein
MGASGCAIEMSGKSGKPRQVSCAKVSVEGGGIPFETFLVEPRSVRIGDDPDAGLELVLSTPEQPAERQAPDARLEAVQRAVLDVLTEHPGASGRRVRALVGGTHGAVDDALALLVEDGRVSVLPGKDRSKTYRVLADGGDHAAE